MELQYDWVNGSGGGVLPEKRESPIWRVLLSVHHGDEGFEALVVEVGRLCVNDAEVRAERLVNEALLWGLIRG